MLKNNTKVTVEYAAGVSFSGIVKGVFANKVFAGEGVQEFEQIYYAVEPLCDIGRNMSNGYDTVILKDVFVFEDES